MDKDLGQKVLTNMAAQQGVPLTSQEIATQIEADPVQTEKVLQDMQKLAYVYKVQSGYWYVTKPGMDIVQGVKKLQPKGTNIYNTMARQYTELTPEMREQQIKKSRTYVTGLRKVMQEYFQHFRLNHPEYTKFYKYMENSPANEEEFYKDVQAMFLRWDMTKGGLAYPQEKEYLYPQEIVALEHFMDESIRRYYKYMEYDRSKFLFQDEYKSTLNAVKEQIGPIAADANTFLAKEPPGTVIAFNAIRAWLNDRVGGAVAKGVNKEVFFEKILQQIPQYLTGKKLVFLSTTPMTTIITEMIDVLQKGKNAAQIFNRLRGTVAESSSTTEDDLDILFQNKDYKGRDFSGINLSQITVSDTFFNDANLSSANFDKAIIEHCDFTNANMKFCNFEVQEMMECTVEGADFDGASISKNIKWDKQDGTAKNVTVSNITIDKNDLRQALESRPATSYSIPLRAEQIGEATALAKALKGVLEKLHTFSGMVKKGWKVPEKKNDMYVYDGTSGDEEWDREHYDIRRGDQLEVVGIDLTTQVVTCYIIHKGGATKYKDYIKLPELVNYFTKDTGAVESSLKLGWAQNVTDITVGDFVKLTDEGIAYVETVYGIKSKYFKKYTAKVEYTMPNTVELLLELFNAPKRIRIVFVDRNMLIKDTAIVNSSLKLAWDTTRDLEVGNHVMFSPEGIAFVMKAWPWYTRKDLMGTFLVEQVGKNSILIMLPNSAIPVPKDKQHVYLVRNNYTENHAKLSWGQINPYKIGDTVFFTEAGRITTETQHQGVKQHLKYPFMVYDIDEQDKILKVMSNNCYLYVEFADIATMLRPPSEMEKDFYHLSWKQLLPLKKSDKVKLTPEGVDFIFNEVWIKNHFSQEEIAAALGIVTYVGDDVVTINFNKYIADVHITDIDRYVTRVEPTEASLKVAWNTEREFTPGDKVTFTPEGCQQIEHIYDIDSEFLSTVIADVIRGSESGLIVIRFDSGRAPTGETVLAFAPQDAAKYLIQLPAIPITEGSLKISSNS